jgi:RimJ/RimL family protein N-acetyltransferase
MIEFQKTIKSEKVFIRPLESKDFKEMITLTSNPKMWDFFTSELSVQSELEKWIENAKIDNQNSKKIAYTVLDFNTNEIIGSTSIGNISTRDQRVEIGWTWVSEKYQGKGYNSHIKYLLLKYCFEKCKIERVEFKTDILNIPARKALKKIGAIEEGILRSHTLMLKDRRRDTVFYSILKNEWHDIKIKNNWL